MPPPLVSKSALSLLGRLAVFGAGLGGLTALGLMLKYLSQSLDGPHNLDLITLLFQAFLVILP